MSTLTALQHHTPATINQLSGHADLLDLPAGSRLDTLGTRARQFVGVIDGTVLGAGPNGETVRFHPGDSYGERELTTHTPLAMTYATLTPARVVVVFGPAFAAIARTPPTRSTATGRRLGPTLVAQRLAQLG